MLVIQKHRGVMRKVTLRQSCLVWYYLTEFDLIPLLRKSKTGGIHVDWIGSVLEVVEFSLMNLLSTEHFNSSLWSNGMWHFFPNRLPQIRLWPLQIAGQIYFQPLVRAVRKQPTHRWHNLVPSPNQTPYWSQNQEGHAQNRGFLRVASWRLDHIWLVVSTPLKHISQLGWWNSRIYWKITFMFQTTNQIWLSVKTKRNRGSCSHLKTFSQNSAMIWMRTLEILSLENTLSKLTI